MSFPASPSNNQLATVNNITYIYSSANKSWTRTASANVTITGNLTVSGSLYRSNLPLVLNDISPQFNSKKSVFLLKNEQSSITNIVDSKDIEVIVNGLRLAPYVTELRFPWITPYDSYKGFRVVTTGNTAQQLVIYNSPAIGQQAVVTQLNTSSSKQKRRYPFSASTIALGD